jgi:hypothetical protein
MVYAVPKSKQSIKQNRFEFTLPEDSKKVYSVPLLKFLRPALILQAESISEIAFARMLFDEYLPEAFSKIDDAEQLQALMAAWQEASGLTTGESPASPS